MPDGSGAVAATPPRVIRVFVSSTFRDMQAERDVLIKKVFPQLRKRCEERAVTWGEVDLRWGITDEETAEGKVLPLCLAEIERCRPWFIGLLGARYGWVPDAVAADLLESQPWLREHLHHSVTELEILHGVLRNPRMADRSLFYFRDPGYLDHLPAGADRADFTSESPAAAAKLADLKDRIRAEHAAGRLAFAPRERYADPEALGEQVLADFTAIIDRLYPGAQVPDPLDQEAARHEAYAQSRRLGFVGREDLLRRLDEHAGSPDTGPLLLTGESGCGKSALLAEWVARWRRGHPDDLVMQHYIGSTAESAEWQGIVRRILGELKRAFDIADEIPLQPDALRAALGDWLVKAAGARRVVLVLDALNQLSGGDAAARQLGWLPVVVPRNVRLLVSSLPGEGLEALHRRGWPELAVPLFGRTDIAPAAKAYFAIFSKKLPEEILRKLESTTAACNALFLRAVLDELRQFGEHRRLAEGARWYLSAPDLPALFDRILTRWHEDFGGNNDLVRRSLCLTACARFGLSEAEVLNLLGTSGQPLPRRPWTPFYLAAESSLTVRAGLLNFGHDHLRVAVRRRWLADDNTPRQFRLRLAEYFAAITEPTDRKLDELPTLLRDACEWEPLKDLLADLPTFLRLRSSQRWKWELVGLWLVLGKHHDPVEVYRRTVANAEPNLPPAEFACLLNAVASYHEDAGRYAGAEPLYRRALQISEQVLGTEHPFTLAAFNNLAILLDRRGNLAEAEPLYRQALETSERVLGTEHPSTLVSVDSLAGLLFRKGGSAAAEQLYRRAVEARERVLGAEHPSTLISVKNLAFLLYRNGDYASAEMQCRSVLEASERLLGTEHPDTLVSVNDLARVLEGKGDYSGAEPLYLRALGARERALGPEHPSTLVSSNNLAGLLANKGDFAGAEALYRTSLKTSERVLGTEHPTTMVIMSNLAGLLFRRGDYTDAESLNRRALEVSERVLGAEHPDTLTRVNDLAGVLFRVGDYPKAEPLYQRALEPMERVLGAAHPCTLAGMTNLAFLRFKKGDTMGSEQLYRRALEVRERTLGLAHRDTVDTANALAGVLFHKGDYTGAELLCRHTLEASEQGLGVDHPSTIVSMSNLAGALYQKGDCVGAEALYRRALEASDRVLGPDHTDTLATAMNLAGVLERREVAAAEPLYRRVLETRERVLGVDHSDTLRSVRALAILLGNQQAFAEAEALYRRLLKELVNVSPSRGQEHPDLRAVLAEYAGCLEGLRVDGAVIRARVREMLAAARGEGR